MFDLDSKKSAKLKGKAISWAKNGQELITSVDYVILAIKPQDIDVFLAQVKGHFLKSKPVLVSVAAGVKLSVFEKILAGIKVIRVMPNLALRINQSVSFISGGNKADDKSVKIVKNIFKLVGEVFIIKEKFMDKVTAITGSGPGYVYYFMRAMYEAACDFGFSKSDARKMVLNTFKGAVGLAEATDMDFSVLQDAVTSKKGTTEAAIKVFDKGKVQKVIKDGINAAYKRAKELSC
ncbi:MAG: pyrroline-5-carboxylate reductase [Candidatus Omnitrophica bacterium]|nr:pyrroline-5-carboxylate reductase [Candidatus Omnitrophota bacterium]